MKQLLLLTHEEYLALREKRNELRDRYEQTNSFSVGIDLLRQIKEMDQKLSTYEASQ